VTPELQEGRELCILRFFAEFGDRSGPSVREVAREVRAGLGTVADDCMRLLASGDLEDVDPHSHGRGERRCARSLRLSTKGAERLGRALPADVQQVANPRLAVRDEHSRRWIEGEIAAGGPIEPDQSGAADTGMEMTLSEALNLHPEDRIIRVRGASMVEAGIADGDLVVIRPRSVKEVRDGDVVVAMVRESGASEITLKHFERVEDGIRLVPANADGLDWRLHRYETKTFPPEEVELMGTLRWVVSARPHARRRLV
jgi:SOS-response transcriptional repressor LexA